MTESKISLGYSPENSLRVLEVLFPVKKIIFGETNAEGGPMVREMPDKVDGIPVVTFPLSTGSIGENVKASFIARTDREYQELVSNNGHHNGNGQKPKEPEQGVLFDKISPETAFNR